MAAMTIQKFCTCLELWKGCILSGIFSMATSIFDLLWSIAHMLNEDNVFVFYLIFVMAIESIFFIAASGVLFIGLVRKSKLYLLPWLLLALIDIVLNFVISFIELTLPNRNYNGTPCIIPVAGLIVTIMVCSVMLYCLICVYAQYLIYSGKRTRITEIRVSPSQDDDNSGHSKGNSIENKSQESSNMLAIPQISTPRDAW